MTGALFVQRSMPLQWALALWTTRKHWNPLVQQWMHRQRVVDTEWDTLNGEDAYAVVYTMDVSEVTTTNMSVFFFVGDTICGITFTDFGGTGTIMNYAQPILDSITF